MGRIKHVAIFSSLVVSGCLTACLIVAGITATCLSAAATASPPILVAKATSFEITLDEYVDIARTQSPAAQEELKHSSEKQMQLLEKLINMNLLADEARRRGYDANPEVVAVKKNRLATLMHTTIAERIEEVEPSEAELRAYYQQNYARYNKPEKIRARHILLSDRKKAQELLNQLKKETVGQYQFRKVAREQSEDEQTAASGGDLEFFTRNDTAQGIDARLIEAAYQIPANGELYPQLIETDAGFHILMRTGHRKAIDLPFEDAKDRIVKLVQRNLHREKADQALMELQKKYRVELHEENLKHVVIDLTKTANGPAASLPGKSVIEQ
ncbi:MAG: peptidyl-prolyl cis-trans isomerase [Deltaproteobacteria bacterium]|nr:peptidyl-prolyl cis-trans isomerase [Deltaproteobacteria bacterium]